MNVCENIILTCYIPHLVIVAYQHQLWCFTTIHNFPVTSWDSKVYMGCAFRNLAGSSRSFMPTVLWTLLIRTYYSFHILFACYIVGKYAYWDAALVFYTVTGEAHLPTSPCMTWCACGPRALNGSLLLTTDLESPLRSCLNMFQHNYEQQQSSKCKGH